MQQIILKKINKPKEKKINNDIEWFCESFGFCSGRDIDKMSTQIINELINRYTKEYKISSELIAKKLNAPSPRINHHVRNLIDSGFLYREKRFLHIRGGTMKSAVEEIRKDANRIFDEIEKIAVEIDESVGLKNR
ncbi:MAG: ArsR family transcriptional regulator [Nanoarchaeota archaeon]